MALKQLSAIAQRQGVVMAFGDVFFVLTSCSWPGGAGNGDEEAHPARRCGGH